MNTNGTAQGPVSQNAAFTAIWLTYDVVFPYVMNRQIFFCPSADGGVTYSGDYGFNRNLCPDLRTSAYSGIKMARVLAPADTFFFLDSGAYMLNQAYVTSPSGNFWYVPGTWDPTRDPTAVGYNSTYPLAGYYQSDYKQGRHNQGCNIGYADGHAKWLAGSYIRGNLQHWTP